MRTLHQKSLSVYLSVCLSICLSVCLSVCLFPLSRAAPRPASDDVLARLRAEHDDELGRGSFSLRQWPALRDPIRHI